MIEEHGQVVGLAGGSVQVQTVRRSACQNCKVRSGCGQRLMTEMLGAQPLDVCVDNTLDARLGDRVVLGVEESALLRASFMVYFLPLMGLLAGGLIGDRVLEFADAGTAGLALFGMAIFFAGSAIARGGAGPARYKPVLLRVLPSEAADKAMAEAG